MACRCVGVKKVSPSPRERGKRGVKSSYVYVGAETISRLANFGLNLQGHSFEGNPPSMFIISPVMNLESLQDKKSTALAMSSGYPVPSRI